MPHPINPPKSHRSSLLRAQLQWDCVPSLLCRPCLSLLNRVLEYFITPGSSCSFFPPPLFLSPSQFCAALTQGCSAFCSGEGAGWDPPGQGMLCPRHLNPGGSRCCPCPSCSPTPAPAGTCTHLRRPCAGSLGFWAKFGIFRVSSAPLG